MAGQPPKVVLTPTRYPQGAREDRTRPAWDGQLRIEERATSGVLHRQGRSHRVRHISVYVHFPWCLQKCPYCDFASGGIERADIPHGAYTEAVIGELRQRSATLPAGQKLRSVFFGGGTPSLWAPAELGRVLEHIRATMEPGEDEPEVTVECNPTSLDGDTARALRDVGVNRLSIGVQSLRKGSLRYLGRLHDGPGALRAVTAAVKFVPRVSADLMFGMPDQDPAEVLEDARALLDLGIEHLSVYALTVEPDTQFGALHRKGRLKLASEDHVAETYLAMEAMLDARGLGHYEVSNYAKAGQESRHNQHYWTGDSYLGLGAGAVGCQRIGSQGRRYRNQPNPEQYMTEARSRLPEQTSEELCDEDTLRECLMLGLRTRDGVDTEHVHSLTGLSLLQVRGEEITRQVELGNLLIDGTRVRVPAERWLHLDGIVAALF